MWHPFSSPNRLRPRRRGLQSRSPRLEPLEGRVVLSVAFDSVLGVGNDTASINSADIAIDSAGNSYITGYFNNTMDFDPTVVRPDGSDVLTSRGYLDPFVAKYAPDNTLVWVRRMGSEGRDTTGYGTESGDALAVDAAGNVYVTGDFLGQADFGPFTLSSSGSTDVYVAKLDPNGNFLWARSWGRSATEDFGQAITVDDAGNVVSAGWNADITSNGWIASGFEVRKYSPTGAELWSHRFANRGGMSSHVDADAAGNIYVSGQFSGGLDFNPDPKRTNSVSGSYVVSAGTANNGYVLKLTAAGQFAWVAPFVAKTSESAVAVNEFDFDPSGNIVVGGSYGGQVDFNPNSKVDYRLPTDSASVDGYVAKLSSAGAFVWATQLDNGRVRSLDVDGSGNIFTSGYFQGVFSPGFGLPSVTSNGDYHDVFVAELSSSGAVRWVVSFGGPDSEWQASIAVDDSGLVYLTGSYSGTVDFDPDPLGTSELVNPSYVDAFLLKLRRR
ncbi:hypothetical protein [Paludisphaera soli]|uniref:hypothetical protein n=1 Tax=Paludisphaera soli TaxID=2712865 RepID=UPI0013EA4BB3|nr:hypothetical protein [Paludisphaera soli]